MEIKMSPKGLALVIAVTFSPAAVAGISIDARSAGMAGVGIASGDFTRANLNPALLTRFEDNDDFYFKLAPSAHAKGYEDTIDKVDIAQANIDQFDLSKQAADGQAVIDSLKSLDSSNLDAKVGLDLSFYVPSKTVAMGISIGTQVIAKGNFVYDADDDTLIQNAINSGTFNKNDMKSYALARGVAITDVGISFASNLELPVVGALAIGITPKMQRLDAYAEKVLVATYDTSDYFSDERLTDDTGFNFDIGVHAEVGPVQVALVGRNLIEHEIVNVENESLSLKPVFTAGISAQMVGITLAADVDMNRDESFVLEGGSEVFMLPRQWAKLGLEVDIFEQIQFRAGYKTDIANNYDDLLTAGIGLSPFDLISLDLAGEFGEDDEMGAALQLGMKF